MLKSLANIMMISSKCSRFYFADYIFILLNSIIGLPLQRFEKKNNSFRYVWESKADGAFAISEDTWNEPLGRGTEIRLHLRDEAGEYLEESKLKVCTEN